MLLFRRRHEGRERVPAAGGVSEYSDFKHGRGVRLSSKVALELMETVVLFFFPPSSSLAATLEGAFIKGCKNNSDA